MRENYKGFSISKEFKTEVNEILDKVPNYSRFICEAIIEKYNNVNSLNARMADEKLNQIVDSKINTLLNLFLIKQIPRNAQQVGTKRILSKDASRDKNTSKTIIQTGIDSLSNPIIILPEIQGKNGFENSESNDENEKKLKIRKEAISIVSQW